MFTSTTEAGVRSQESGVRSVLSTAACNGQGLALPEHGKAVDKNQVENFSTTSKEERISPSKLSRKSRCVWDWILGFQSKVIVKVIEVSVIQKSRSVDLAQAEVHLDVRMSSVKQINTINI